MSSLDDISVVFEGKHALVIFKPAGLVVHSDGRTDEPNVCDWVLKEFPEIEGVGEAIQRDGQPDIARPGIVHRLDRETSGVLIIARTNEAYADLKQQFKSREIEKTYDAFVYGNIEAEEFSITDAIGRSSGKDFRKMAVEPYVRGKARKAETSFETVKKSRQATHVKAYPKTGRTHQIRVHLKSIHRPIICDSLYASGKECFGIGRQALHARRISFSLPDGAGVVAEADVPPDLKGLSKQLFSL